MPKMEGMDSSWNDVPGKLSEQLRHQVRITRKWMTWWIPAIFAVGLGVCILGLIPSVTASVERGSPGFSHDLYEQEVRWHAPSDGLRTVEALRQNAGAQSNAPRAVIRDLEALTSILRVAAERNVEFSLVLRLHANDSMQGVCTREVRQGSYW